MANMITPAMLQTFERAFHVAAQQKQTLLSGSGVVKYLTPEGKTNNYATLSPFESVKIPYLSCASPPLADNVATNSIRLIEIR